MLSKQAIRKLEKNSKALSKIGCQIISILETDANYYSIRVKDITIISNINTIDKIISNKSTLTMYIILKYLSTKYEDNIVTIENGYFTELLGVSNGMFIDCCNNLIELGLINKQDDTYTVLDNKELTEYTIYKVNENYFVYKFINAEGNVIYVGRTQNIKNRMKQHFGDGHLSKECYNEVSKIEYTTLDSEVAMVICEIYFINKYNPKYNTSDLYRGEIYLEDFENNLEWEEYKL